MNENDQIVYEENYIQESQMDFLIESLGDTKGSDNENETDDIIDDQSRPLKIQKIQ